MLLWKHPISPQVRWGDVVPLDSTANGRMGVGRGGVQVSLQGGGQMGELREPRQESGHVEGGEGAHIPRGQGRGMRGTTGEEGHRVVRAWGARPTEGGGTGSLKSNWTGSGRGDFRGNSCLAGLLGGPKEERRGLGGITSFRRPLRIRWYEALRLGEETGVQGLGGAAERLRWSELRVPGLWPERSRTSVGKRRHSQGEDEVVREVQGFWWTESSCNEDNWGLLCEEGFPWRREPPSMKPALGECLFMARSPGQWHRKWHPDPWQTDAETHGQCVPPGQSAQCSCCGEMWSWSGGGCGEKTALVWRGGRPLAVIGDWEVEGRPPRGRPRKTYQKTVEEDLQNDKAQALCREEWRKSSPVSPPNWGYQHVKG